MVGNYCIQYYRIASNHHLAIKRQTKQTDRKNGVIKALTKGADRCNQRKCYYKRAASRESAKPDTDGFD